MVQYLSCKNIDSTSLILLTYKIMGLVMVQETTMNQLGWNNQPTIFRYFREFSTKAVSAVKRLSCLMWVKQCHKPAIWEWFKSNLFKVKLGMVYGIVLPTLWDFERFRVFHKAAQRSKFRDIHGRWEPISLLQVPLGMAHNYDFMIDPLFGMVKCEDTFAAWRNIPRCSQVVSTPGDPPSTSHTSKP